MSKLETTKKLSTLITFIVAAIITVLNVAQIVFIATTTKKTTIANYENECTELAKAYTGQLSGKVSEYFALLNAYTEADVVQSADNARIIRWLENHANIRPKAFDYVAWVDTAGNFDSDKKSHPNVKERDYFIQRKR